MKNEWINLGQFKFRDMDLKVKIPKKGAIPDIHVFLPKADKFHEYYEDASFLRATNKYLKKLGYEGPNCFRAELGLQSNKYVVLEPDPKFYEFAKSKGWVDMFQLDWLKG